MPVASGNEHAWDDAETARITAAIARGDHAALASFYEAKFAMIFRLARTLTGRDEAFCLDVVQDAVLKIAGSIRPMRTTADLDRWLVRVVHTVAIDRLRQEHRRAARERHPARRSVDAPSGPDHATDLADRLDWLRRELAKLEVADAAVLAVRFAGEATLAAAGEAAGCSADAAHGRVRRTIERLRRRAKEVFRDGS